MAELHWNANCRPWWMHCALLAVMALTFSAVAERAQAAGRLVSDDQARHLGLTRAWFAQVRLNPARSHVVRSVLYGDRLTVLTSAGVVHEFDALTGTTLWVTPLGNADYPSLGPTASADFVALVNGSTLYVLDRKDGRPTIVRPVGGAPGAAPALASQNVFVPLVTGRIEAYPLGRQTLSPWYYQSFGRAMVAPLATPGSVVWTTDAGYVYVGRASEPGVRFRVETRSEIIASPASRTPMVYVATVSGELYAIHETTGARRWKYATGFPIMRAPAAVQDRVFVTSTEPVLHCVDAATGALYWEAERITQFAAASRARVYAVDVLGAMVVLDADTGQRLGRITTDITTEALVNDQTDRIYLVSTDGVVQCLHEVGAPEPLYHATPAAEPSPDDPDDPSAVVDPDPVTPPPREPSPFDPNDRADGIDLIDPFDF